MTTEAADRDAGGLEASLDFRPGKIVETLRPLSGLQRNDLVWGFLIGAVAPTFGSLLSVFVWVPYVWNAACAAAGRYPMRLSRIALACSAVAAAYGAVKLGFTIAHSGWEGWERWPGLFVFFAPVFFLLRLRLSDSDAVLDMVILGAGFSVILALPYAAYEAVWLGQRAEVFCGNSNVFGVIAAIFGSIGALNVLSGSNNRRWLGIIAFVAMVLCVLASGRRIMVVALPLLTLVILWAAAHSVPRRIFRKGVAAMLVFLAVVVVLASGHLWERMSRIGEEITRIEQEQDYDSSTGLRILMWKGGLLAAREAPFAGYGITGRMDAVRQALPEEHRALIGFTHPHNGYLAALLDAGILGLIVLLAMSTAPVWLAAAAPRDAMWRTRLAAGWIVALSYAVSGAAGIMFEHDLMDAAFVAMLIVIAASAANRDREPVLRET